LMNYDEMESLVDFWKFWKVLGIFFVFLINSFFEKDSDDGNRSISKIHNPWTFPNGKITKQNYRFFFPFYYTIFDPFFILFRKMLPKISHFYFPRFLLNEKISFRNRREDFLVEFSEDFDLFWRIFTE
jgi:hypothetical protein